MTLLRSTLTALLILALAGCGGSDSAPGGNTSRPDTSAQGGPPFQKEGTLAFVREGDTLSTLDIEIAETEAARQRGLMQRLSLPVGSGMLFIFPEGEEQVRGFWMKNTPMSLDILFASADSQIVRVAEHTTPYSTERVSSEVPARFVVEVPAGYADRQGIVEGDRIRFRRTAPSGSPLRRQADAARSDSLTAGASSPGEAAQ